MYLNSFSVDAVGMLCDWYFQMIKVGTNAIEILENLICFIFCRFGKEDSPDPTDLAIVDLQGTRIGRPGLELAYFFCSSTSPQQRRQHFDELIEFYFDRFVKELKDLESPFPVPFTLDELKKEYDDCFEFGFIMGCGHAQVTDLLCMEWNKFECRCNKRTCRGR